MTRKRYQKLVRAFITKKHIEGKQWFKEPMGKTYRHIRNTKVNWNMYRYKYYKDYSEYNNWKEFVDPMMYSCSLYLRDYVTSFDPLYTL